MQEQPILTLSTPTDVPWNKGKLIGAKPPHMSAFRGKADIAF